MVRSTLDPWQAEIISVIVPSVMPIFTIWSRWEIVSEIFVFIVIPVRSVSIIIFIKLIFIEGPVISISKIMAGRIEMPDMTGRSVVESVWLGTKM